MVCLEEHKVCLNCRIAVHVVLVLVLGLGDQVYIIRVWVDEYSPIAPIYTYLYTRPENNNNRKKIHTISFICCRVYRAHICQSGFKIENIPLSSNRLDFENIVPLSSALACYLNGSQWWNTGDGSRSWVEVVELEMLETSSLWNRPMKS